MYIQLLKSVRPQRRRSGLESELRSRQTFGMDRTLGGASFQQIIIIIIIKEKNNKKVLKITPLFYLYLLPCFKIQLFLKKNYKTNVCVWGKHSFVPQFSKCVGNCPPCPKLVRSWSICS
jgi:hypothetical protein